MTTQPSRMPQSAVPAPTLSASPARRSWLGRNWKWLLATFLLGGLAFVFGLFALIMGTIEVPMSPRRRWPWRSRIGR